MTPDYDCSDTDHSFPAPLTTGLAFRPPLLPWPRKGECLAKVGFMIQDTQHTVTEPAVEPPTTLRLCFGDNTTFRVNLTDVIRSHRALAALADPAPSGLCQCKLASPLPGYRLALRVSWCKIDTHSSTN